MFGLNMLGVYGDYKISFLGGATLNLVVTLVIRLVVGIGWYKMFERAGKTGWLAFVPVLGAYNAFRLTCDDFSWAALFGGTTFIAWVDAVGIEHPIVTGCAVCNFIMWWAYALMTAHVYRTSYFFGMIYGVFPWLGAIISARVWDATASTLAHPLICSNPLVGWASGSVEGLTPSLSTEISSGAAPPPTLKIGR